MITRIAVILPSRGLVHSQTMESLLENLCIFKYDWKIFFAHDLPIPDCFNVPLEKALQGNSFDYILFVEEDMLLPWNTLDKMIKKASDVVSVDYANKKTGKPFMRKNTHDVVEYTGVGCMLVKKSVFDKLEKPYFREGCFEQQEDGTLVERVLTKKREAYGTQDVYFCNSLTKAGFTIDILEDANIGHLLVEDWGKEGTNNGAHKIKAVYI